MSMNAKIELYRFIGDMRRQYPLLCYSKNRDIEGFCIENNIELHLRSFTSQGVCGVAFIGKKHDTIILNSHRNKLEMVFDFIHELVHTKKHRNLDNPIFTCFEQKQNSYIEWEANEGAAEFLVPYKVFIPLFSELYNTYINNYTLWKLSYGNVPLIQELADRFNVTEMVIRNRIKNLPYEIDQYRNGVDVNYIYLLSATQQSKYNIVPTNYDNIISKLELKYDFEIPWDGILSANY